MNAEYMAKVQALKIGEIFGRGKNPTFYRVVRKRKNLIYAEIVLGLLNQGIEKIRIDSTTGEQWEWDVPFSDYETWRETWVSLKSKYRVEMDSGVHLFEFCSPTAEKLLELLREEQIILIREVVRGDDLKSLTYEELSFINTTIRDCVRSI